MGSHVSTHKTKNLFIPSSSTQKKPVNGEHKVVDLDFKSQSSSLKQPPVLTHPNFGSIEETFFDSQAWLDSDCDDDFRSVNGDFTPSRGSTSSNQGNSIKLPHQQVDKYNFLDGATDLKSEPSPTDKKKRLSELFEDGFVDEDLSDEQMNTTNAKLDVKQTILDRLSSGRKPTKGSSPYVSSPSRYDHHLKAEKSTKSAPCSCLPGLMISRSFREWKKKPSPGPSVVGGG